MEWQPINTAPFDRDLELAVLDRDGVHTLVFPCRRILGSWINAETKPRIDVRPHALGQDQAPGRPDLYFSASLTASRPTCAHSSSWSAVPPLTPIPPTWTLSAVMIGSPPANAMVTFARRRPGDREGHIDLNT
jgi:hypothetical protein